jgi:peptide/nickel transport system permease protein
VTRLIVHLLLRRLVGGAFLIFAVVTLTFFVIRLAPGDPAFILAGESPTPEFLAQVRAENGLDKPVPQQFLTFLRTPRPATSVD